MAKLTLMALVRQRKMIVTYCCSGTICLSWLILIVMVKPFSSNVNRANENIVPSRREEAGDVTGVGQISEEETFPKIIHQVWLGYDASQPPDSWKNATWHSTNTNPDFAYRLWSQRDVMQLLTSHYPWFVPTYLAYPYDVQRANAARYFIIRHHGGIYLDMDEVSLVPISQIIAHNRLHRFQCVLPAGTPTGVTNYIIICKRHSPFMVFLTSRLVASNGWYGIPYATVMWSTGPRFISATYDSYPHKESIYVMSASDVTRNFQCLFGQSWFGIDGVILHTIVYPFVRMGVSWIYLDLFCSMTVLLLTACIAYKLRNKLKTSDPRRFFCR